MSMITGGDQHPAALKSGPSEKTSESRPACLRHGSKSPDDTDLGYSGYMEILDTSCH